MEWSGSRVWWFQFELCLNNIQYKTSKEECRYRYSTRATRRTQLCVRCMYRAVPINEPCGWCSHSGCVPAAASFRGRKTRTPVCLAITHAFIPVMYNYNETDQLAVCLNALSAIPRSVKHKALTRGMNSVSQTHTSGRPQVPILCLNVTLTSPIRAQAARTEPLKKIEKQNRLSPSCFVWEGMPCSS